MLLEKAEVGHRLLRGATQRYRLTVELIGSAFRGWQRQSVEQEADGGPPSAQRALESALGRALPLVNEPKAVAAGRLDAGVHALGQVCHIDIERAHPRTGEPQPPLDACKVKAAINSQLRHLPLRILDCRAVGDDFHARFSAVQRTYHYRIRDGDVGGTAAASVFDSSTAWCVPHRLQVAPMQEAADALVGTHDFANFCYTGKKSDVEHTVRHIVEFGVERCTHTEGFADHLKAAASGDGHPRQSAASGLSAASGGGGGGSEGSSGRHILIKVTANGFLYHQVRRMVWALAQVGRCEPDWVSVDDIRRGLPQEEEGFDPDLRLPLNKKLLNMAPACGLFLTGVTYPTGPDDASMASWYEQRSSIEKYQSRQANHCSA
jgi:tRNA pseudouridine38-40 synthase